MTLSVTAIVPTFNRAHYLGECLESLLGQSRAPDQIIVVDDASTDQTQAVAETFQPAISYVKQSANAGKAAALNRALDLATGDTIWIFDDDDIADPNALFRLVKALESDANAGWAFGNYDNFSGDENARVFSCPGWPSLDMDDIHMSLLLGGSIFQPAMLVRRACYSALGGFDTGFARAQDYDMLLRLSRRFPAQHVPAILFHQRQHLGPRGPANMRIDGAEVWKRQTRFDAAAIRKVYESSDPADYLPRSVVAELNGTPLSTPLHRWALVRRSAAVARRQLWDLAISDLKDALALPTTHSPPEEELRLLFSHIWPAAEWADDEAGAEAFLNSLLALPSEPLTRKLRHAVTEPMLRSSLREVKRRKAAAAYRRYRTYRRFEPALGAVRHCLDMIRRKFGHPKGAPSGN